MIVIPQLLDPSHPYPQRASFQVGQRQPVKVSHYPPPLSHAVSNESFVLPIIKIQNQC
jgi:hypothetical protein